MAMTESTMLELGSTAADFSLPNTEGMQTSLNDFKNYQGLVVAFICNHCPYVIHIAPQLAQIAKEYQVKRIGFVAINSNDTEQYPQDNMDNMIKEKQFRDYPFPYLLDGSQEVAKTYAAACTPDLYLFDENRKLVYRGQFDESRPHRISSGNYDSSKALASGKNLREAMDTLLAGQAPLSNQVPSMGCNIKWR